MPCKKRADVLPEQRNEQKLAAPRAKPYLSNPQRLWKALPNRCPRRDLLNLQLKRNLFLFFRLLLLQPYPVPRALHLIILGKEALHVVLRVHEVPWGVSRPSLAKEEAERVRSAHRLFKSLCRTIE